MSSEIPNKHQNYYSFDEAVTEAKRLFDESGVPHQVALNPNLVPGGGSISWNPETNGINLHPFNPTVRQEASSFIVHGLSGDPEVKLTVAPPPKDAQN